MNRTPTLEQIRFQVSAFSLKTFGKRPYTAPLHHLKKEIEEVLEEGKLSEYADCLLLLLDSFNSRYPDMHTDDLLRASAEKLDYVDKNYVWGEPDEHGDCQHIIDKSKKNNKAMKAELKKDTFGHEVICITGEIMAYFLLEAITCGNKVGIKQVWSDRHTKKLVIRLKIYGREKSKDHEVYEEVVNYINSAINYEEKP